MLEFGGGTSSHSRGEVGGEGRVSHVSAAGPKQLIAFREVSFWEASAVEQIYTTVWQKLVVLAPAPRRHAPSPHGPHTWAHSGPSAHVAPSHGPHRPHWTHRSHHRSHRSHHRAHHGPHLCHTRIHAHTLIRSAIRHPAIPMPAMYISNAKRLLVREVLNLQ